MRLALIGLSTLALIGCDRTPWRGWIYPDRADLTRSIEIGPYRTLDDCRQAVRQATTMMIEPERWDYECGLSCKMDKRLGVNVCKTTER